MNTDEIPYRTTQLAALYDKTWCVEFQVWRRSFGTVDTRWTVSVFPEGRHTCSVFQAEDFAGAVAKAVEHLTELGMEPTVTPETARIGKSLGLPKLSDLVERARQHQPVEEKV